MNCRLTGPGSTYTPFKADGTLNLAVVEKQAAHLLANGVALSPSQFLAEAADRIPNLAGIKFASNNMIEYQLCPSIALINFKAESALSGRDHPIIS